MKKFKNKRVVTSSFICPDCNKAILMLPRNHNRREKGHIKDLFCPWCKIVQKCMEVRDDETYKTMSGEIIFN